MIFCFDTRVNFEYTDAEMALAKKKGIGILYDAENDTFLDFESNVMNINGVYVFPRTGSAQIYEINDSIIRHGGIPVLSNEEVDIVNSWPNYVQTKRNIKVYNGSELCDDEVISKIEEQFGTRFFFKTKKKDFKDIIDISLFKNKECAFFKALSEHKDDEFFISDEVEVASDNLGIEEYRVFVEEGRVMNISRMTTDVFHRISPDVVEYALTMVDALRDKFPSYYSFDVFRTKKNGNTLLDVVEFNPIHAAGIYLYNSIIDESSDLEHINERGIAREFMGTIGACTYDGSVINNRENTYKIPDSFSSDLKSFAIEGKLGLEFTTLPMKKSMYANTKPLFCSFSPIMSDADLLGGNVDKTNEAQRQANKSLTIHKENV